MRRAALLLLLAAALALPARGQFFAEGTRIYRGEAIDVAVPQGADTLVVTYRPSSAISHTVMLPTGGARSVSWTPEEAGVVALSAGGTSENVSVRFRSVPPGGLLILLLAGTILFGGAGFALKKLFEDDSPPQT
ncbi:MAG: hypothetical protein ACR2GR_01165 [Rhodothermales bacterium]